MMHNSMFRNFIGNINAKHIWWLNIGAEDFWNINHNSILPQVKNTENTYTVNRTEQLCMLLAADNDIVIQKEKPSAALLDNLQRIGFNTPEIYVPPNYSNLDEQCSISELILKDENLITRLRKLNHQQAGVKVELVPYAVTHFEEDISLRSGCQLIGTARNITTWVNSKVNARLLAEELDLPVTEGYICHSVQEAKVAINNLKNSYGTPSIVIKEAYGASGKGLFIANSEKSYQLLMNILDRRKNIEKKAELIVEKWYDTYMDLNYQIYINETGHIRYIQPKSQINNGSIYIGSEFPIFDELNSYQKEYYEECAMKIGQKLWNKGYRGFASIDSIITKEGKIIPIIEINGRFSLSTYISFIPEMLGKDKFYRNKYYKVKPGITFEKISKNIDGYNYTHEKGEGLIIYSFAEGKQELSEGRLFALIVTKKRDMLDCYERKLCQEIDNVNY